MSFRAFFAMSLVALAASGCEEELIVDGSGGSGNTGTGGAGNNTGACNGLVGTVGAQPAPPVPGFAAQGPTVNYVVDHVYFGDITLAGAKDPNAWREYGFNIDNLVSAGNGAGACLPQSGVTPAAAHDDGLGGIDNAFGRGFVPMLLEVDANFGTSMNNAVAAGDFNFIHIVAALGLAGSYESLAVSFEDAAPLGHAPAFDALDVFPFNSTTPPSSYTCAYMANHVLVAAGGGPVYVPLDKSGGFNVVLHRPVVELRLSDNNVQILKGTLSGVVDTEQFVETYHDFLGKVSPSFCTGSTWDDMAARIRGFSDMMADGTQNPNAACDGISFGLAFTGTVAQPPTPVALPAAPNSCP